MKSLYLALVIFGAYLSRPALAQQAALPDVDQHSLSGAAGVEEESPAQQRIAGAELQIKADPKKVQAYNELALGFLRRPRIPTT